MENFTIMDGVVVAVVSILTVFLVLIGLQLVINLFKFFSGKKNDSQMKMNKEDAKEDAKEERSNQPSRTLSVDLPVNEELKTVAALMALILANDDHQDKQYRITLIKRIR